MSKNSPPNNPIPPPKLPPVEQPPTDRPPPNPLPPQIPLLIELLRVDLVVLRECEQGERVTVCWQENPPIVATLAGVRLGDINAEDYDRVRLRKSSRGVIASMDVETLRCIVEVL